MSAAARQFRNVGAICSGSATALGPVAFLNRDLKRDRLPSGPALSAALEDILAWWRTGWLSDPALAAGFAREVAAALPVPETAAPEDVFAGLEWRRLRLRQDQQVAVWAFPR